MVQRYTGGPEPSVSDPIVGLTYLLLFVLGCLLLLVLLRGTA